MYLAIKFLTYCCFILLVGVNLKAQQLEQNQVPRNFDLSDSIFQVGSVYEYKDINFRLADTLLRPSNYYQLDKIVEFLKRNPALYIEIQYHWDYSWSDEYSDKLPENRAIAIKNYLVNKGICENRLTTKGFYNSDHHVITNEDAEKYPFLEAGKNLTFDYIQTIENWELRSNVFIELGRRTVFKITSN